MRNTSLLQVLAPDAASSYKLPLANTELRWPGMKQDWQYIIETPGKSWQKYGSRQRAGSYNPRGPTNPAQVLGFKPYPPSARIKGELDSTGSPMVNEAPRPFADVSPHPPLDLRPSRWDYHTFSPDQTSPVLTTASTGSTLSKIATPPPAWNPHFEHLVDPGNATVFQNAPPTMEQYPGTLVADHLTPEEFKAQAPAINPGEKGTLIVHGTGLGVLAKLLWIRDFWVDRFLAEGLQADHISGSGLNDFVISWSTKPEGMRAGPILIGAVVIAILLVLGWLSPRLSLFVEKTTKSIGGLATNLGLGVMLGALALAFLARSSKRGIL